MAEAVKTPRAVKTPGEDAPEVEAVAVADPNVLPDISTIDLDAITKPVLTIQGWALPNGGH